MNEITRVVDQTLVTHFCHRGLLLLHLCLVHMSLGRRVRATSHLPFFIFTTSTHIRLPHIYNRQLCTHLKSRTDAEQHQETEMEREMKKKKKKTSTSTAATLCVDGPNRCRRGTKACSASLGTVRQSHLWGARNAPSSSVIDFKLR